MSYTCPSCGQLWQRHEISVGAHTCSGHQPAIVDPRDAAIAALHAELADARKVIHFVYDLLAEAGEPTQQYDFATRRESGMGTSPRLPGAQGGKMTPERLTGLLDVCWEFAALTDDERALIDRAVRFIAAEAATQTPGIRAEYGIENVRDTLLSQAVEAFGRTLKETQ